MEIEIKKLSPDIIDDFLYFFDNVAFTDHEEWADCYCMFYHINAEMEEIYKKTGEIDNRKYSIDYIKQGKMNGYIAYHDNKPVGWLNIDAKSAFYTFRKEVRPEMWTDDIDQTKTKCAVCFTIAPDMRGKGIATKLLQYAAKDSAKEGYEYIEAYPIKGDDSQFHNYHGYKALYEKCGFYIEKELETIYIMRRKL